MFELLSFSGAVRTAGSVLLALVILLAMITVHEFGHYLAGKIFRFKINEFAVGFGPALFKHKKKDGEFFSLRCIPLGGYCAFEGEDCEAPHPAAFNNKKPWQRIVVLFAGAFTFWLTPIFNIFSRKNEYEADKFAASICGGSESLVSALRKLHKKNLGNLTPHPLYSAFYYSHPTLLERQEALSK